VHVLPSRAVDQDLLEVDLDQLEVDPDQLEADLVQPEVDPDQQEADPDQQEAVLDLQAVDLDPDQLGVDLVILQEVDQVHLHRLIASVVLPKEPRGLWAVFRPRSTSILGKLELSQRAAPVSGVEVP